MSARARRLLFLGVLAAALAARLAAFLVRPDIYPDAFFQYLEPAWWKLHGYGWLAWEWAPSVGLRSWVPPGYYGAWMVLLGWLGITDPAILYDFFALHWCALSLAAVAAAYRIGFVLSHPRGAPASSGDGDACAFRGGIWAALGVALCPVVAYFTPQTIIDSAVLVPFGLGFAAWLESTGSGDRRAWKGPLAAGLWLGLGSCLRIPYAPLAVLVGLDFAARGRLRQTLLLALGALVPVLFFGAVDWLTWGEPFHSMIAFVDYNFVQGKASQHGVSPPGWYVETMAGRGGAFLALSAPLVLLQIRRAWKPALLAIVAVAYLSTQAHKEERFALVFWPLWCAAFGVAAARTRELLARRPGLALAASIACGIALALLAAQGAWSLRGGMGKDYSNLHGLYDGQTWVGRQPDATGLLLPGRPHLNGGCFRTGRNLAFAPLSGATMRLPLFNYAIVPDGDRLARPLERQGFRAAARFDRFAVYKRTAP